VFFVLANTLAQSLHVPREHSRLANTLRLQVLPSLSRNPQLILKTLEFNQVLLLNLCELSLDNIEFLFVLEACFAESICELLRLRCVQVLIIVAVLVLLHHALLTFCHQLLALYLSEFNFIF